MFGGDDLDWERRHNGLTIADCLALIQLVIFPSTAPVIPSRRACACACAPNECPSDKAGQAEIRRRKKKGESERKMKVSVMRAERVRGGGRRGRRGGGGGASEVL